MHPIPSKETTKNMPTDKPSVLDVFLVFLRLGLTAFGGPIAHLGYFREEFVTKRHWLSERAYADLVALCQFLPGPASSQVGISLGFLRAGYLGAVAAWLGFTMPSVVVLILFALGVAQGADMISPGVLQGLKVVAVAVVAQAVWGMGRQLCPDAKRITFMAVSACLVLAFPSAWGQVGVILLAALVGLLMFHPHPDDKHDPLPILIRRRTGILWLFIFFALLLSLPLLHAWSPSQVLAMLDVFYRTGSLVFGGGHVVLPLLQSEVVPPGWVSETAFLAGYGATQAVPGPMFTFAAFLGASMQVTPNSWASGLIAVVAIFLPSFFLVMGALPFWEQLRRNARTQAAMAGINAAVVGLLLAALYQPVWTSAVLGAKDFGLALVALVALMFWKLPPWLVVLACALAGWGMEMLA